VLSAGHSNHEQAEFLALLRRHSVTLVADVRSAPYSHHAPQFNREMLAAAVERAGMEYVYLGRELGGKPEPPVPLERIAKSPEFIRGVERLAGLAAERQVAIICGEENPARCHRRLLIAPVLGRLGVEMRHVRADGRVQSDDEVEREASGGQTSLEFGE